MEKQNKMLTTTSGEENHEASHDLDSRIVHYTLCKSLFSLSFLSSNVMKKMSTHEIACLHWQCCEEISTLRIYISFSYYYRLTRTSVKDSVTKSEFETNVPSSQGQIKILKYTFMEYSISVNH